MDAQALGALLEGLIQGWEDEVTEFKQTEIPVNEIGKYFSALSNEGNLRGEECGWLVLGVNDRSRTVCGTSFRGKAGELQKLKMEIGQATEPSITFRNIHELEHEGGRVLLFEVPSAPRGMPIAWKGHYYARAGESLTSLGLDKLDDIRGQMGDSDWSAQVVAGATLEHLDDVAIAQARELFAQKYANRFKVNEVMGWSDAVFLDRAKLTRGGELTRATLLLLGKAESAHLLTPLLAQITWKLDGEERAYQHFGLPFLLSSSHLYQKIRNIQIRILPTNQLVAVEIAKYDQKIVLEALHNCIAHQDYGRNGRIVVTEYADRLVLENEGAFFEGQPMDYISGDKVPRRYRNPFLVQAMSELNMIDTMGFGIHSMYRGQARRYLPLPDYDLSEPQVVKMTIHGGIVDPAYSRLLIEKTDLELIDILALDRVQKKLPIDDGAIKRLRRAKLIEGRKPNFHVSSAIAQVTASEVEYIHTRGQDDAFYKQLIIDYLQKFGSAARHDIDKLLFSKLGDVLDDEQKKNKISNLLTSLRRAGAIENTSSRKAPTWALRK